MWLMLRQWTPVTVQMPQRKLSTELKSMREAEDARMHDREIRSQNTRNGAASREGQTSKASCRRTGRPGESQHLKARSVELD